MQIILWGNIGVLWTNFYAGLPFTGLVFGSTDSEHPSVNNLFVVAVLALGLNEAAYAAELVRAGIISVDAGQTEAALVARACRPLLITRRIAAAAGDARDHPDDGQRDHQHAQDDVAARGTAAASSCSAALQSIYSQTFQIIPLLIVASAWYLIVTSILTVGQARLEAHFGKGFGAEETEAAEKRAARRPSARTTSSRRRPVMDDGGHLVDAAAAAAAAHGQPMVKAEQVWKSFGKLDVLKGVDFVVQPQQTFVLLGPSGGGKSTLLRCINHLEKIDAGRLWVAGELMGYREKGNVLHEMKAKDVARQRASIGMVFQRFNLFPHKTAIENVMEAPVRVQHVHHKQAEQEATTCFPRRPRREARHLPGAALRRPAAARRHRAGTGHEAQADALRRAHLGARPGAGRRGARRDEAARHRRYDDGGRDPRDGLRQGGRRRRRAHGRRRDRRARARPSEVLENPKEDRTKLFLSKVLI